MSVRTLSYPRPTVISTPDTEDSTVDPTVVGLDPQTYRKAEQAGALPQLDLLSTGQNMPNSPAATYLYILQRRGRTAELNDTEREHALWVLAHWPFSSQNPFGDTYDGLICLSLTAFLSEAPLEQCAHHLVECEVLHLCVWNVGANRYDSGVQLPGHLRALPRERMREVLLQAWTDKATGVQGTE